MIPKKFESNPNGKVALVKSKKMVVPPPKTMAYKAALEEGFFRSIVPKTGINKPETINP